MTKWQERLRALTLDEIRTLGFVFGCLVVTFWVVTAVVLPSSPAPNPGLVATVAGLLLQQAFKKDGNTNEETSRTDTSDRRVVPPVVDGSTDASDERPDNGSQRRRARPLHLRALFVAR